MNVHRGSLAWYVERDLLATGDATPRARAAHHGLTIGAYLHWVYGPPTAGPKMTPDPAQRPAPDEAMLNRIASRYAVRFGSFTPEGRVWRMGQAYPVVIVDRPAGRAEVYVIGPGLEGWVHPDEIEPLT